MAYELKINLPCLAPIQCNEVVIECFRPIVKAAILHGVDRHHPERVLMGFAVIFIVDTATGCPDTLRETRRVEICKSTISFFLLFQQNN